MAVALISSVVVVAGVRRSLVRRRTQRMGRWIPTCGSGGDVVGRGALLTVVAISADIADGVAIINTDINAIAEFTLLNLPIMISVKYSRY